MSNTYDSAMTASRKLTDDEAKELRSQIIQHIQYSAEDEEDVNDLLDYTFAMVSNGKSLEYVVQELVSMEMDICREETAHKIAMQIAQYLQENVNHVVGEESNEEEESGGHRVVSLKVRCFRMNGGARFTAAKTLDSLFSHSLYSIIIYSLRMKRMH